MAIVDECREKMDKTVQSAKEALGTLRAGRVTASLLDRVEVKAYGMMNPLKTVGSIQAVSPTELQVKIFDPSIMKDALSSINKANLGCNVAQNGNAIVLRFPAPSEERRKDLEKQAKKYGEDFKVALRNVRKDYNNKVKKDDTLSEDMQHDALDKIQKATDSHVKEIEALVSKKINDIETI